MSANSRLIRVKNKLRNEGPKQTIRLIYNYVYRRSISRLLKRIRIRLSCNIDMTSLPESTILPHACGIVIHNNAKIGKNTRIYQNVTIGGGGDSKEGVPTIKQGVTIYAGATIIGNVVVGKNSTIGANAVVVDDIPPNSTAVGIPAAVSNKGDE